MLYSAANFSPKIFQISQGRTALQVQMTFGSAFFPAPREGCAQDIRSWHQPRKDGALLVWTWEQEKWEILQDTDQSSQLGGPLYVVAESSLIPC